MSPTTPVYALRYPASTDPADVPTDMGELATDVENKLLVAGVTYGTTPPATPVDGQLWAYPADTTNGIIWMFRYRSGSSSAYKFEFVGGPPVIVRVETQENTTSGSFVELATQVRITVARAGDYLLRHGAVTANTGANACPFALTVGGTDGWARMDPTAYTASVGMPSSASDTAVTGLAASTLIAQKYASGGGTAYYSKRFLELLPIRVS